MHTDLATHIRITQGIGRIGGSGNRNSVAQPLVTKCAYPVGIADPGSIRRQGLVFGDRTGDRRHTNRGIIHRIYRDVYGGRIRSAISVAHFIGKAVCTIEVGIRGIGERAIRVKR